MEKVLVTGGSGFEPLRSKNALHPAGCGGKIDAKTRLEKMMPKLGKSEPKGSRNGVQNASKMSKRGQRGAKGPPKCPKCQKKGMPKMMPKFDAEKEAKKSGFWSHFDSPGGRREVRRASLRGWQDLAYLV